MNTFDIDEERSKIVTAAEYISELLQAHESVNTAFLPPRVLIICGSGLGGISHRLSKTNPLPLIIPY